MKVSISSGDFGREMLLQIQELEKSSGIKLSKQQKIIIAEIGTVEQVLSILLDSPISVKVKKNVANDGIIEREVVLTREGSADILIHAIALIKTDGLPSNVLKDIRAGNMGIGTIINRYGLETFRKVVEVGYDSERETVYRRYEILYGGEVRFRIKEEFSIHNLA